jgi:branched-chain amino acid transport system ATP-binding protein
MSEAVRDTIDEAPATESQAPAQPAMQQVAVASQPNADDLLRMDGVDAFYGHIQALRGVTLSVRRGEIVTLIGSNGAGKTTTLKTISGLVRAQKGTVTFDGKDITAEAAHRLVPLGIGHVPEGRRIFSRLTVMENLQMGGYTRNAGEISAGMDRAIGLFPRLGERRSQRGGSLSGGEQQMLAIGRALMSHPKLLLLDEPSLGLSPILVQQIFSIIEEINRQGTTILLVEQNALQALKVAGRGYVLQTGSIILADNAADLAANEQVRKAYLGEI